MSSVPDYMDTPKTAAANAPVDVILLGAPFPFREPRKVKATALLGRGMRILAQSGAMDGAEDIDLTAQMANAFGLMERVEDIIAFVCDALDFDRVQKARLEAEFDFAELNKAYQTIIEVLQRPFVGGSTDTGRTKAAAAPSTSGECETVSCPDGASPGPS